MRKAACLSSFVVFCVPVVAACAGCIAAKPAEEAVEESSSNLSAQARVKTAEYLDTAAANWVKKDTWGFVEGGRCVMSCHTTVPFMMMRSKLPAQTGATATSVSIVRGYVEGRVNNWATVAPLYDWVPEDSRGTEAVANAVALVSQDMAAAPVMSSSSSSSSSDAGSSSDGGASTGPTLSATAKAALAAMWNEQQTDGSFAWWDSFSLAPWENTEAKVWGNALADYVVGTTPASYIATMSTADKAKLAKLDSYLRARATDTTHPEALHNKAMILLASTKRPDLLTQATKTDIINAVRALQSTTDGSWSAGSLGLTVSGGATAANRAHPYPTAFFTYVLASSGDTSTATTTAVANGRGWLETHQRADGAWEAKSLNKPNNAFNNSLITDGATAWAILALTP